MYEPITATQRWNVARHYVPRGHSLYFIPGETYVEPATGRVVAVPYLSSSGIPGKRSAFWDWEHHRWTDKVPWWHNLDAVYSGRIGQIHHINNDAPMDVKVIPPRSSPDFTNFGTQSIRHET